jgi:hypothetical protein
LCCAPAATTTEGSDPRNQFGMAQRLDNVVVGTVCQGDRDVELADASTDQKDGEWGSTRATHAL